MRLTSLSLLCLILSGAGSATAQATLGRPDAVSEESFSLIRGVRELADGRVLVADWRDQRVLLLSPDLQTGRPVGRTGAGPAEFRLPVGLLSWRGDSTLLVDQGNARLAIITPEGRIARTIPADRAGLGSPAGVDRAGRIYFGIPPWSPEARGTHPDSVVIIRLDPATGRDEPVVTIKGSTRPRHQGPRMTPGFPMVAFAPQDAIRIMDDGTLVVVRSGDYRVERIRNGVVSRGPANPWPRESVRAADRTAFVTEFVNSSAMSGRGPDGGMGLGPVMSREEIAQMVETNEFAEVLPPFHPGGVVLSPDGELWVETGRHAGAPAVYDRLNPTGVRIGQVRLGPGRALVTVGRRHLYVVATDADGLQTLERYRRP